MVAPRKQVHRRHEMTCSPRPTLPKLITCSACGYDLPAADHPRNDRLHLLDVCPKCRGFAWELIDVRSNPMALGPMPYEPCPHCKANRAGIAQHMACDFCGLTLKPRWGVRE